MSALARIEPLVANAGGRAPLLLVCEHASNHVPAPFGELGLPASALEDHVAWDIGALALAQRLAQALDAPLVAANVSRLVIDPNRAPDAHDLIPESAEGARVAGNEALAADARAARIAAYHTPFHEAVAAQLERSEVRAIVAVHSFTPALFGKARPWHAGMLHAEDARIADVMIAHLSGEESLVIGRNEPYAPAQGVYYTMERHAAGRANAMIEVRNDLLRDEAGQEAWAARLAPALRAALDAL